MRHIGPGKKKLWSRQYTRKIFQKNKNVWRGANLGAGGGDEGGVLQRSQKQAPRPINSSIDLFMKQSINSSICQSIDQLKIT